MRGGAVGEQLTSRKYKIEGGLIFRTPNPFVASLASHLPREDVGRTSADGQCDRMAALSWGARPMLHPPHAELQRSDMVVFGESFATLDSETLQRALDSVLRRATTLPITSHPG